VGRNDGEAERWQATLRLGTDRFGGSPAVLQPRSERAAERAGDGVEREHEDAEAEHAERQDQPTEQQCSEGSDDEYDD